MIRKSVNQQPVPTRSGSTAEKIRSVFLPEQKLKCLYFNLDNLRNWLILNKCAIPSETLKRYMVDLTKAGLVQNAGRGWYSFLPQHLSLDTSPVADIVKLIETHFPLLDFACWSTQQINAWTHHMLGRFVSFVHTPRDAMAPVYEYLRDSGYTAFLNPNKQEAAKTFTVKDKTVVVLPLTSKTPINGRFFAMEGILVELFLLLNTLDLMDKDEFVGMACRIASEYRLEMSELASFAKRRYVETQMIFGDKNQPIPLFLENGIG
ncbi:MAG: hypothetical protein LBQ66_10945 [Planctomycetaceae bacterium]|jgi:hypothetical protein|nr:hypothetical protein [Planctomycetaceae bacterium]